MKINITFEDGTFELQAMVSKNAVIAAEIMSRPAFAEKIRAWRFDNTKGKSSQQIAADVASADNVNIRVAFYNKVTRRFVPRFLRWVPGLAARDLGDEANGVIRINTAKLEDGAGGPGNMAHEVMHFLGYEHIGNSSTGNENTVPYRIGEWVDVLADRV